MTHPLIELLREVRTEQGVSLHALSVRVNTQRGQYAPHINGSNIGQIERGARMPSVALLEDLLNALGYELEIVKK